LYQAQPAPPVGNQSPVLVQPNTKTPSAASNSVSSQNLLGIQSSQLQAQYAITGKQMSMQIINADGHSSVETLAIEGNVKITEKVTGIPNGEMIEITGGEITVWNPSSPETQIMISGKQQDAVFQGRGVTLTAKEINLSRSSNKIWVPGVGRLIANTDSNNKYFQPTSGTPGTVPANAQPKTAGSAGTSPNAAAPLVPLKSANSGKDNTLLVEWNESMIFNGRVLQFFGKPDRNNNRVRAIQQDKIIWCDVMEIHLNRLVLFFDDPSEVKPEAEMIQCANNVYIQCRELDENNQLKSLDSAEFGKLRFYVQSNYFVAEGPSDQPGVLRSTRRSSEKGFSDSKTALPGPSANPLANNEGTGLNFLSIWFHNHIQGTFLGDQRSVEINGRVQTVYTPVESWEDRIGIDNINAARKRGYILECEQLHLVEMPDPNNAGQSSAELTASDNASIDGNKFYGSAKTIKYNQAKTLVTFDGNAKIHLFEEGRKSEQMAETIQYNTETKAIRLDRSQGINIGQ
jgi:hypothetical protein